MNTHDIVEIFIIVICLGITFVMAYSTYLFYKNR